MGLGLTVRYSTGRRELPLQGSYDSALDDAIKTRNLGDIESPNRCYLDRQIRLPEEADVEILPFPGFGEVKNEPDACFEMLDRRFHVEGDA